MADEGGGQNAKCGLPIWSKLQGHAYVVNPP